LNYDLYKDRNIVFLGVESSFTLIDFILFFFSFILGFVFALFFFIFAFAVLQKIFSRYEFEFDSDSYTITKYYKFFGYFRIRIQTIGYGEIDEILLSDYDSGKALFGKGMASTEWYTIDLITQNGFIRMVKADNDELDEVYEIYEVLKERMDIYFRFRIEFIES
jgi:hypothetical protein